MNKEETFKQLIADIGVKLAELRESSGFSTIKDFVKQNDLPEIQYWRMERGKANITIKSLNKILLIHNLTPTAFFKMVDEMKIAERKAKLKRKAKTDAKRKIAK